MESKRHRIWIRIRTIVLTAVLALLVGTVCYGAYTAYGYVRGVMADAPDISLTDAVPSGYMSTVCDEKGDVTAELVSSGSNRVYVELDEIPLDLQHAFVAIEDERFYEHNGVDLKGILRAGAGSVMSGSLSEGASTITQQLLKNNVFGDFSSETMEEKVKRKLQEQYLAVRLEREASKDWIMENYLNTINLGQNTLGVQAAADRYFGKDVTFLNLSECAVLAAITQNPSRYNPISNPEENSKRRLKVLSDMLEQGYITQDAYEEALADDVYSRINKENTAYEDEGTNVTSYFVDALTKQVIGDLEDRLGYTEAQAYNTLYSGGLTVYSTQDSKIQKICDSVVNDDANYDVPRQVSFSCALTIRTGDGKVKNYNEQDMLTWEKEERDRTNLNFSTEEEAMGEITAYRESLLEDGGEVIGENVTFIPQPQASMTVIDQSTGQVKALVGGRGDKAANKTLNRASDTTMQPGSTFKILTTYAPALDEGLVSLSTIIEDEEVTYADGTVIKNADGKYRGATTVREAIRDSVNAVAIKTSREVTLEKGYQSALDFGISTLTEEDEVEALPLGGVKNGVTNMEMAAAYAAIADGGVYNEPTLYTKILDHDGNVLIDRTPESHRVIKDSTAFLLTSAMEDVASSGTGEAASFPGMSIAGKTGTTTASRASWFVGYTPYYTCAVWGGYDDNSELSSTAFTKTLWRQAMSQINAGLEDVGFACPDDVDIYEICRSSGEVDSGLCKSTYEEYLADDVAAGQSCSVHEAVRICRSSGKLAGPYCPENKIVVRAVTHNSKTGKSSAPTEVCDVHTKETFSEDVLEGSEAKEMNYTVRQGHP